LIEVELVFSKWKKLKIFCPFCGKEARAEKHEDLFSYWDGCAHLITGGFIEGEGMKAYRKGGTVDVTLLEGLEYEAFKEGMKNDESALCFLLYDSNEELKSYIIYEIRNDL